MLSRKGKRIGRHNANMRVNKGYARLLKKLLKNADVMDKFFNEKEWLEHRSREFLTPEQSERLYGRIADKLDVNKQEKEEKEYLRVRRLNDVLKYTAAAILIAVCSWLTTLNPRALSDEHEKTFVKHSRAQPPAWTELVNQSDSIRYVNLPDSSLMKLYPRSSVRYLTGLSGKTRDIHLAGKAYFSVKKDRRRAFSVLAGGLKTTAIGTSFTVNSLKVSRVSVKLHSGKIVVKPTASGNQSSSYYLARAGAVLDFNERSGKVQLAGRVKEAAVKQLVRFSHEQGILSMENVPMEQVITLLNEAYHVQITAERPAIANITYTGQVDTSKEQVRQVLDVICLINNLRLQQSSEQVFYILK